jgi:hypothetical protein
MSPFKVKSKGAEESLWQQQNPLPVKNQFGVIVLKGEKNTRKQIENTPKKDVNLFENIFKIFLITQSQFL